MILKIFSAERKSEKIVIFIQIRYLGRKILYITLVFNKMPFLQKISDNCRNTKIVIITLTPGAANDKKKIQVFGFSF
jgi:hypothetical protein